MRKSYALTAAFALTLTLAGCGDKDPQPAPEPTVSTSKAIPSDTVSTTPTVEESTTPTQEPASADGPTTNLLAWEDTGAPSDQRVTTGGPWTLTVDAEGSMATLAGPTPTMVAGTKRFRVKDAFLESDADGTGAAVVVLTDTFEEKPAQATIIDLASGTKSRITAKSDVPPATGGSWALGDGTLAYPTVKQDGSYCLATAELEGSEPGIVWCAEPRHGFNNVRIGPLGVSLMSFDDARPSCRSVGAVSDDTFQPIPAPTKCKAWEYVGFESQNVWSEVPKDKQLDAGHVYVEDAGGRRDLGAQTSGTLTPCGSAVYWVRDPQAQDEPARLMRFTDAGAFEIVYESAATGNVFLGPPRCGGDRITVTSFGEGGDEQVSATLE